MRRALFLVALLPVAAVLTVASGASAVTGDQAHGAGTLTWSHCPTGSTASFEFNATGAPTGQDAAGTFSFSCSPTPVNPGGSFSGTISCLVLGTGIPTAVMGGTVTVSTHPAFPVGVALSFGVMDGGPAGAGDLFSSLSAGADCAPYNTPYIPLTSGDIVVAHVAGPPPPPPPTTVVLTPPTAINDVGTTHTVTAKATTAGGAAAPGFTVYFTVSGSISTSGQCTTDAQGQCTFTYSGPQLPGADLITGCADTNRNGRVDTGEPCGEATKVWMLPATTPGEVTGGGWISKIGGEVAFGFNARSKTAGGSAEGQCNVVDRATKTHIKCLSVDTLVVTPTHATLFGKATVDGVATGYRIDVDDLGEPGTADTFKILTDSGYVAAGTLQGGNIQIHK
jgi:hypothetical protein